MIPPDAELTARPAEIPAWDDMPDDLKPVLARQMEVYAGFLEHTDHHVGRLIDALADLEILDDTLVYYIIGDNGASAEGTPNGCFNEIVVLNGAVGLETAEFMNSRIDDFGTPEAYNHYAVGWAHAMDTPYQWTKQVASHWGGTRNGTIVHWPAGIKAKGEVRAQFRHVIDIAPTVLDAAGIPEPTFVHGVQQKPIEGRSMRYAVRRRGAAEHRETQYFEMFCNRGIYHKGWTAVTRHSIPWVATEMPRARGRRLGTLRPRRLDAGARPRAQKPEKLASCSGCSSSKRRSTTCCPSTTGASSGSTQTSPAAAARCAALAAPLRRYGPPFREFHRRDQEQVAFDHGRDRGAGR